MNLSQLKPPPGQKHKKQRIGQTSRKGLQRFDCLRAFVGFSGERNQVAHDTGESSTSLEICLNYHRCGYGSRIVLVG